MTAENELVIDKSDNDNDLTTAEQSSFVHIPTEIQEIFEFLSNNNEIVFKSQQIDDPELRREDKVNIAKTLYVRNRQTFLCRFGCYFQEKHLASFDRLVVDNETQTFNVDEHCDEMHLMLLDFQCKLQTRQRDVKNRRYAAMQKLIKKGEYFSEQEMMKRAPELYQELVGQYLSEEEKKKRDCYDVKNTTFSGILMHTLEQREMADVLQRAEKINNAKGKRIETSSIDDDDNTTQSSLSNDSTINEGKHIEKSAAMMHDDVPVACRQQWGNFDNEQIACSTSRETQVITKKDLKDKKERNKNKDQKLITAGERELLRQEFIGIMHEQFLAGKDVEFDYTQVDDNADYDDLTQLNQDKEDLYFTETDSGDEDIEVNGHISSQDEDDESEDALDVYMRHLNQHHSLKKV